MSDGIILRQGINSLASNNEIKGNLNISGDTVVGGIISGDGSGLTNIPISGTTNLQNTLDGKTENIYFTAHTGDTTIHYTKSSINLSDLGSSAHTHPISEVVNLQTELDSKLETTTFNSYTGSVVDVFVSSGNANAGTQQLSFTNTTGGTFNVTNSAALFADNDINVTGGTYDNNTGCVTFTTNSGTTFDVCGFVTGLTDTFVTGGTLSGSDLILERNSGVDVSGIDLSGLVSGKLDITLFNTYTGDTETALNSKLDTTTFNTYSGSVQTELDGKVETSLFNTYTGNTETTLNTKIETASNVGGANNVFSGKSGTDLQFRTISGGTNTTVTTVDGVIKIDVAGTDNFYVTGGTLSDGTLTLERNDNNSVVVTGFTDGCQSIVTTVGAGNTELYSLPLSANTGAFFIYSISGLTGARTGTLTTVFSGNSANIGDLSTDDIGGSTSGVSFNMTVVSNEAKLNVSADTGTWSVDIIPNICGATTRIAGGEVNTASNVGSGEGIFSGKSGTDLQFKTLTSTGGTVTITSTGDTVNLESSGGGGGGVSFGNFGQIPVTNVDLDDFDYTSQLTFNGTTFVVNNNSTNANLINAYRAGFSSSNGFLVQARGDVSGSIDSIKYRISRFGSASVLFHSTSNHPLTLGAGTSSASNSSFHIFQSGNVAVGTTAVTDPSSKFWIKGSNDLVSGSNLKLVNNSENTLFEVKNDGTVVIPNVGSTTPVTNLGVDASGNVVSGTTGGGGGEANTASNIGGGEGLFSTKSGVDLQFKSLTSTGGTVTITSTGDTVNLESSGGGSLSIGDSIVGGTNNSLLLKDSSGNLDSSDNIIYTETGTVGQEVVTLSVDSWGIKDGTINAVNAAFPTTYYTKLGNSGKIEGAYNGTKWSMESDGTYNYYRSVTAHPCIFQTSNGTYTQLWLDANSNKVKIGAFVAPSATLDVRGEGSSSGTTALLVENNSATTLFEVKDDGTAESNGINILSESMVIAVSDETTALTSGTNKLTFRMPYAFTLTEVRASLTTSGTTGGLTTVDINESGVSILSTKLTIDQGEKTSTTAATPPVISDTALADDSEITVDIDTVTTGGGETGLKIYLIGYRV